MKYLSSVFVGIASVLFIWSFSLTTLTGNGGSGIDVPGYILLLTGWLDVFQGIFSWVANPLFVLGVVNFFRGKAKSSMYASGIGFLLALQYLMYQGKDISYFDSNAPFGTLAIGYYVWLLAIIIVFCVAAIRYLAYKEVK